MLSVVSNEYGFLIMTGDETNIYLQDGKGNVYSNQLTWVSYFLGARKIEDGYGVFLYLDNGGFAEWIFDKAGFEKEFYPLKDEDMLSLIDDLQVDIKLFPQRVYTRLKDIGIADYYYKRAKKFLNKGNYNKAERLLFHATVVSGNCTYATELANFLSLKDKFFQALNIYIFLAAKYPNRALETWCFKQSVIAYWKENRHKPFLSEIISELEKIALVLVNRGTVLDLLSDLYLLREEYDKALETKLQAANEQALMWKGLSTKPFSKLDGEQPSLRIPDFLVLGAQKTGTTALYQYLVENPEIYPAASKEIFFFDYYYEYGLDWYKSHFPSLIEHQYITGESSATYFNNLKAAERILNDLPEAKLIFILRDPIDRAISDYYMKVRDGLENRSIEEAMLSEIEFLENTNNFLDCDEEFFMRHQGYIRNGIYYYFLALFHDSSERRNSLIIKSSDLLHNPRITMKRVFEFLEVPDYSGSYGLINSGNYERNISSSVIEKMKLFFEGYNTLLKTSFELDLS